MSDRVFLQISHFLRNTLNIRSTNHRPACARSITNIWNVCKCFIVNIIQEWLFTYIVNLPVRSFFLFAWTFYWQFACNVCKRLFFDTIRFWIIYYVFEPVIRSEKTIVSVRSSSSHSASRFKSNPIKPAGYTIRSVQTKRAPLSIDVYFLDRELEKIMPLFNPVHLQVYLRIVSQPISSWRGSLNRMTLFIAHQ